MHACVLCSSFIAYIADYQQWKDAGVSDHYIKGIIALVGKWIPSSIVSWWGYRVVSHEESGAFKYVEDVEDPSKAWYQANALYDLDSKCVLSNALCGVVGVDELVSTCV